MKKEIFNETTVNEKNGSKVCLTYYLLTGCVNEEFCDLTVYGIEIARKVIHKDGKTEKDAKIIPDLFFVRKEAESFLEDISRKKVTPTDLKFAVREYIGERLQTKNVESV